MPPQPHKRALASYRAEVLKGNHLQSCDASVLLYFFYLCADEQAGILTAGARVAMLEGGNCIIGILRKFLPCVSAVSKQPNMSRSALSPSLLFHGVCGMKHKQPSLHSVSLRKPPQVQRFITCTFMLYVVRCDRLLLRLGVKLKVTL